MKYFQKKLEIILRKGNFFNMVNFFVFWGGVRYLKSMVICQSISAEELVRNFSSKKKEYLELADFQRFFSLIARLPMNTPIFREIWDAYSSQSKFGEKEMSVMITSE